MGKWVILETLRDFKSNWQTVRVLTVWNEHCCIVENWIGLIDTGDTRECIHVKHTTEERRVKRTVIDQCDERNQ